MKDLILQDIFLNHLRREHLPISLRLSGGEELWGTIRGFDGDTVILDTDAGQIMAYKSGILYVRTESPVMKDVR